MSLQSFRTQVFFQTIKTEEQFETMKKSGMLWVYYPESSGSVKEYLAEREMWLNDKELNHD